VVAFVKGINWAGLTNLKQATATVTGATAYGISSDQITFGWITGTFSGKSLGATGLANGTAHWNGGHHAGTILSTSAVTVTGGALTTAIPASIAADIAFKIISPGGVGASLNGDRLRNKLDRPGYSIRSCALRLLEPLARDAVVTITTVAGREIARYTLTGSNVSVIPVDKLESGIYCVKIISGNAPLLQKLIVAGPNKIISLIYPLKVTKSMINKYL